MAEADCGAKLNRQAYDRVAAHWDAARSAFWGPEQRYLDALLEPLTYGAVVLDLGCGTGRPMAGYLLERGLRVIGVDQSEAMLDIARRRYPGGTWVAADLVHYVMPAGVSAIVLWDSLFHIARNHHGDILRRAAAALPKGGRLMLTTGGSDHPPFTDTMFGETFFYDSHPPERMDALLRPLGFGILLADCVNQPDGARDKGRYAYLVERR